MVLGPVHLSLSSSFSLSLFMFILMKTVNLSSVFFNLSASLNAPCRKLFFAFGKKDWIWDLTATAVKTADKPPHLCRAGVKGLRVSLLRELWGNDWCCTPLNAISHGTSSTLKCYLWWLESLLTPSQTPFPYINLQLLIRYLQSNISTDFLSFYYVWSTVLGAKEAGEKELEVHELSCAIEHNRIEQPWDMLCTVMYGILII